MEAVYRTDWFKDRLEEFIKNIHNCKHDIPFRKENICNFYEGYYDFDNGMARFSNLKCAIPKNDITKQWDEVKQK